MNSHAHFGEQNLEWMLLLAQSCCTSLPPTLSLSGSSPVFRTSYFSCSKKCEQMLLAWESFQTITSSPDHFFKILARSLTFLLFMLPVNTTGLKNRFKSILSLLAVSYSFQENSWVPDAIQIELKMSWIFQVFFWESKKSSFGKLHLC